MDSADHPELVVADLDGVLADTFRIHVEGWKLVMDALGVLPATRFVNDLRGVPTRVALETLCKRVGVECTPRLLEEIEEIKNRSRDDEIERLDPSCLRPGAREFLEECRRLEITTVCVATSTATPRVIEKLGIQQLFDEVRHGNAVRPSKSESSSYIGTTIAAHNLIPQDALVVDDGALVVTRCLATGIPAVLVGQPSARPDLPQGELRDGVCVLYQRGCVATQEESGS